MENYRNNKDVISFEGIHVDAGSLWKRNGQQMILVDEDQHVTMMYDKEIFEPEKPEEN